MNHKGSRPHDSDDRERSQTSCLNCAFAKQERVDAYLDQHLAKLFLDSEWSQEDLAEYLSKRWGKSVSNDWVAKHLRLGRFLRFFNTTCIENGLKLAKHFTEGAFRRMWEGPSGIENVGRKTFDIWPLPIVFLAHWTRKRIELSPHAWVRLFQHQWC